MWYLVAHSCGKTSFCRPPSSVPRWRRWREGMIRRWSLCCIFLSHRAPQKLVLAPMLSFMPWGHCYCFFFCHMVISFAVSLLLLPWGFSLLSRVFSLSRGVFSFAVSLFLLSWAFFLLPWVFPFLPCFFSFLSWGSSFRCESFLLPWVFLFCRESFSFAVSLFLLPRSYFFCRYSCGHHNRIAQMIFQWKFYLFFSLPEWKELCKPSLVELGVRTNVHDRYFLPPSVTEGPITHFFSPNSSVSLI